MNLVFKKINKDLLALIFIVILSLPVMLPYTHKGFFPTHDGEWAVVRLSDMYREVKDFQIPPRFSGNLNFGYGYPLFNFAYPFPYYAGLIVHLMGFGFVDSIKLLFVSSVFLSAVLMYIASSRIWESKLSGIISSLLYVYLPYRLVDLYVRGSIGESLAFVIFPLIIICFINIYKSKKFSLFIPLLSFAVAILITTHNIMSVLFALVMAVYFIPFILKKDKKTLLFLFFGILLGAMLSAYFWIPAIIEKSNVLLSVIPIADRKLYYVKLDQLFEYRLGYGTPTDSNSFSYQIGFPQFIAYITVFLYGLYLLLRKRDYFAKIALFNIVLILAISMLLFSFSSVFWENIPLFKEINYPWTLLAVIGFLITLTAGYLGRGIKQGMYGLILAIIAVFAFVSFAKPQYYVDRGDGYYFTNDATTTSSDELMPLWVKEKPKQRVKNKVEIIKSNGEISNLTHNSSRISFDTNLKVDTTIRVNTIYYPGWNAYLDGKKTQIYFNNEFGVMELFIPKDSRKVELSFTETPLRLFANSLSVIAFIALITIFIFRFMIGLNFLQKKAT